MMMLLQASGLTLDHPVQRDSVCSVRLEALKALLIIFQSFGLILQQQ
jgi:hypothetical protein